MTSEHNLIDAAERRRYYRIDDRVALSFRTITDKELTVALSRLQVGYPDKLSLASAFAATSAQMRTAMERIHRELPDVACYLEGLNEKLDLLVQLLAASEGDMADGPTHDVNLSASGMSFRNEEAIEKGTILEIKLLVFPSYVCILAFGTVVHCSRGERANPGTPFVVGVDFTHIRESDRDLVIRHVTQKQSIMLREARMALDEEEALGAPAVRATPQPGG